MKIKLKDGTEYVGASNSTIEELIIFVLNVEEFVDVYNTMTDENLSEFTVGDTTAQNRTLMETKTYKYNNFIEAHFVVLPTEAEILIEASRALATVNADKAEAFDILMGGAS